MGLGIPDTRFNTYVETLYPGAIELLESVICSSSVPKRVSAFYVAYNAGNNMRIAFSSVRYAKAALLLPDPQPKRAYVWSYTLNPGHDFRSGRRVTVIPISSYRNLKAKQNRLVVVVGKVISYIG